MANTFPDSLGTDFYCETDISDDFAYENDPVMAYTQACFRRVQMLNLFYATPYGAGLFRFVLETGATSDQMRGAITDALMLDERTENVEVTFEAERIRIHVTPRLAPSFRLTIDIAHAAGVINGAP